MDELWRYAIGALTEAGVADPADQVVAKWLHDGDVRPLAWALTSGQPLAPRVMATVGHGSVHSVRRVTDAGWR
jgi:hypothetical protein